MVATLIPPGIVAQGAVVEEIRAQVSFYRYCGFARSVAGSAAIVEQFLLLGVEVPDREPGTSKAWSRQDADVFVHNGPGMEAYADWPAQSDDQSHVVFVMASDGLALISPLGQAG